MWRRPLRMKRALGVKRRRAAGSTARRAQAAEAAPASRRKPSSLEVIAAAKALRSTTGLEFMLEARHLRSEWHGNAPMAYADTLRLFRSSRPVSPIRFHQQTREPRDLPAAA